LPYSAICMLLSLLSTIFTQTRKLIIWISKPL